jgi:hypothetical protein
MGKRGVPSGAVAGSAGESSPDPPESGVIGQPSSQKRGPGAPLIPCECCATAHAFKRRHGCTPAQAYRRAHWPIFASLEENSLSHYHALCEAQAELERERRSALAYCIECRNPLVATPAGFQYCPYERAGGDQHAKVKQAIGTGHTEFNLRRSAAQQKKVGSLQDARSVRRERSERLYLEVASCQR